MQQAVGAQELNMVVLAVSLAPTYDTLTQQSKPGNLAVGGVDVAAHLPYLGGFGFYPPYPLPFMHSNAHHCSDDGKREKIS